jgi:hypothetical protein
MSLLSPPRLQPCNCWSPHQPGVKKKNHGTEAVPVQCNRPEGHEGNHMCLLGSYERLAEWEPAKVVK